MKTVWIDIAIKMTIAMVASTWGVFLKRWLERPKTSSEQNVAANNTQKSSWRIRLKKVLRSPRIAFVAMFFGLLFGVYDYRRTAVVSKRFVIDIAYDAVLIAFSMFLNSFLNTMAMLRSQDDLIDEIYRLLQKQIQETSVDQNSN